MSVSKLEEKPIGWFKPDPENVKLHSEMQIEQIMASIRRNGMRDPVGTDEDGHVLEGHGRLEACRRLKFRRVPALVVTGLSEAEKKAYAIAHNQTTMNTSLDPTLVRQEFERLNVGPDDYQSLGYSSDDMLFLLSDAPSAGGTDHNGHERENLNALVDSVVHSQITFPSQEQMERFTRFLVVLRMRYPDRQTIAERLDAFVTEYSPEVN
jgi:hypothetical protein